MKEFKLERRKMTLNTKQRGQEFVSSAKIIPESPPEKPPDKGKQKFLRLMLREKTQMKLLPWSTLAIRYEIGSYQVWYTYTKYSKAPQLIITENGRRPSTNHYNIKLFEVLPEGLAIPCNLIRCLTSKTVPLGKSPDQIVLALEYSNRFWKICAVCQKDDSLGDSLSMSVIDDYYSVEDAGNQEPAVIDLDEDDDNEELPEAASDDTGEQQDSTVAVLHENLQGSKKTIYCSRRRLKSTKLRSANNIGWNIQQLLCASIPSITLACKWRVICMNLGFAYLSLLRNSYTIKYDDIMKAVKLAQTEKKTLVLKSKELQKKYPHSSFGIYCVHNYGDKIFVGPYFVHEDHDLDTLRFANGALVNTDKFNQTKGRNIPGSGFWFHQVTDSEDKSIDDEVTFVQYSREVIDLTCDNDDEVLGEVARDLTCDNDDEVLGELTRDLTCDNDDEVLGDVARDLTCDNDDEVLGEFARDLTCDNDDEVLGEVANSPTPQQQTTLLELVSTLKQNDEEKIADVEKTLDAPLKTGQLNVNQRIVSNVVSTSQSQPVPTVDRIPCDSGYDDDDEMVVDKISDPKCSKISDEIEIDKNDVMHNTDESKQKYILTNIPNMGYIETYHYKNYVDVMCPITNRIRRFRTPEIAVTSLDSVLSKQFILIPSTFKLKCRFAERVEDSVGRLDDTMLNGHHIAGAFGVKNIFACNESILRDLGMDRNELLHLLPMGELARLLKIRLTAGLLSECLSNILEGTRKEIDILQKERDSFANEKLSLQAKKDLLTERCSKLIADFPMEQQSKVQEELDQVFSLNPEKESVPTLLDVPGESDSSSMDDPIEVLDNSDEDDMNVPRVSCSATTRPAPKGVVTSSTLKINSNYIAVREGSETKYIQITSSDNDGLSTKPLQAVKRKR